MNAHTHMPPTLTLVRSSPAANDTAPRARPEDPLTRAHARLSSRLRAAAQRYVAACDVDDLVQDVWVVAARMPSKLTGPDGAVLNLLIGIAKRCAPSYVERDVSFVSIDEVLLREAGDDLEGAAIHAPPQPRGRKKGKWEEE
jgi:DNA-directed RNA polymerase specialized sigma24 family protein